MTLEFPSITDIRPVAGGDRPLPDTGYLAFPFRVLAAGPAISGRAAHVREQIELLLFTAPGERPHRPTWGAGVAQLVFETGGPSTVAMVRQRLVSTLAEALAGEVDPESVGVEVAMVAEDTLQLHVTYRLATVGQDHEEVWTLGAGPDRWHGGCTVRSVRRG